MIDASPTVHLQPLVSLAEWFWFIASRLVPFFEEAVHVTRSCAAATLARTIYSKLLLTLTIRPPRARRAEASAVESHLVADRDFSGHQPRSCLSVTAAERWRTAPNSRNALFSLVLAVLSGRVGTCRARVVLLKRAQRGGSSLA